MKSRYESLVWVEDNKGEKYVCPLEDFKDKKKKKFEELTDEQKRHCSKFEFPFN